MIEPTPLSYNGHHRLMEHSGVPQEVAPGERQEPPITVGLVIRALRRWWKIALPLALLLAAGAAAGAYFLFVPVYESSAWLQIEERPLHLAFTSDLDSHKFVQTQIEILRSPLVLGPVVGQPEVAQLAEFREPSAVAAPIEYLAKNLKIKAVGSSELYTITWQGPNPTGAAAIVNAVVDTYLKLRSNQDAERTQRVIELVQQERDRQEKEVELLQQRIRELTKQVTGKDPFLTKADDKTNNVIHQITNLQGRLTETEVRRVFLEAEIAASEEAPPTVEISKAEIDRAVAELPEVRAFAAQLAQQQAALRETEAVMAPAMASRYQSKAAAIREQEAALAKTCEDLRKQVRADMERSRLAQSHKKLAEMKSERKSLQRTEELLKKRIEETRKDISESSTGSVELAFLQADLKRQEDVFDRIASRLVALRTEQRAPGRVSLLQKAAVPQLPVVATPYKKMVLLAMACFMTPFGLAVFAEKMLRRISDSQQIREHFRLPVVNEVARLPAGARGGAAIGSSRMRQDLQLFRESIDSLRVSLVTSEDVRDVQVLAVTSAATNEGKTSVSVQLAVSIARASGEKVLIIDGDMRSPDVHRVLGTANGPGLADLLAHRITLDDGPIVSWASRVDVLPAGRLDGSPHGLLGDGRFGELLADLRPQYRYIVIDTPPVLAASESVVLNREADASILCTMRDVSRVDQVTETHSRLLAAGARPVRIVLSGVPTRQYGYRYGEYYGRNGA